ALKAVKRNCNYCPSKLSLVIASILRSALRRISASALPFLPSSPREAHRGGVCGGGRSGVGGAKGGGQGEYAPAKHVLDSEPGSRVTGAGAYTATCAVTHPRQEPYAGKPHVGIWCSEASCHFSGGVPPTEEASRCCSHIQQRESP